MNLYPLTRRLALGALAALILGAGGPGVALAQAPEPGLHASCTNARGALFRVDNFDDREFDFTLRQAGGGAMVSGSAYPIGRGGALAYLPAGSTAELVVRGEVVATANANAGSCPGATTDTGRPICEGVHINTSTREALFVAGADSRGVVSIDITVSNGRVLVYDPHALFVVNAGGAPAPVFIATGGTTTFSTGAELFHTGYGMLLQGNASGPVAFFATVRSPGGVVECDPRFVSAEDGADTAEATALGQNFPNPLRARTEITFTLEAAGAVKLQVYDLLGRHVATLVDAELGAGNHAIGWDGIDASGERVASGTYLYRLDAGATSRTRTMTVLR